MKESKRVQQALSTLEKMTEYLHYYMGDCPEFRVLVRDELRNLEDLMRELAVDQKIQNIKLAQRLRKEWDLEKNDN